MVDTVEQNVDGSYTAPADPLAGQRLGQESSLSNWAGDYVTDMLGLGWAQANQPTKPIRVH